MKYTEYNIKLTFKAILMFEKLTNHSFLNMVEDDMAKFLYCVFVSSNSVVLSFKGFLFMMEDKKFADWLSKKVEDLLATIKQFGSGLEEKESQKAEPVMLTQVIGYMAANGVDINYLMNSMELWEVDGILNGIQNKKQDELEMQRLWTYINISPLIDGKKVKNPQALIKFPWEREAKNKKAMDDLKAKQDAIKAFFIAQEERNKQKEQEKDAKDK